MSGPIVAMIQGGFTVAGGQGVGYVHVYVTAATTISGPAPAVGEQAHVVGSGSTSTSISATSVTIGSSNSPSPSPIPGQPGTVSAAGPITATFTGGFTINAGKNVGYMHVYTNAKTTVTGGAPQAGHYAQATGTGSLATSITATYVATYAAAPGATSATGTATSATSYGFTLAAGSAASVPIVMNGATIVGGSPLVTGAQVRITGTGSPNAAILASSIVVSAPSPSPGASPTPTPPPISTTHVLTADYLGAPWGTTSVAWQAAAAYLTWAQVSASNANAASGAGMKTQLYADPNREAVGDPLYTTNEAAYAHDCSGNRVYDTYNGTVTQYVTDPSSAAAQANFASYVSNVVSQSHYDAVYEDDAGPLSAYAPYTPFSAMPCGYSDAAWLAGGIAINAAPPVPVIFNGLSGLNGHAVSLALGLLATGNALGANFEHCYSDDGTPKMTGWLWQAIENSELQVLAQRKLFECQLRDSSSAAASTDARLYAYASFLLTYDPKNAVFWEEYATPSGLHVLPESQLVALNPLAPAPGDVSGLLASGGTYGRQYADCYVAGTFAGPCAVVVNPDSQLAHPFPYPQYGHSLVLSGSGVLDGGTISTQGPAPGATLAPSEAAIVFP